MRLNPSPIKFTLLSSWRHDVFLGMLSLKWKAFLKITTKQKGKGKIWNNFKYHGYINILGSHTLFRIMILWREDYIQLGLVHAFSNTKSGMQLVKKRGKPDIDVYYNVASPVLRCFAISWKRLWFYDGTTDIFIIIIWRHHWYRWLIETKTWNLFLMCDPFRIAICFRETCICIHIYAIHA